MSEPLMIDTPHAVEAKGDGEVHLLDLLVVLAQNKLLVIGTPIVVGTLAMVASLLMTPMFASTTKLMPPQQQQGSAMGAMLGQLGGLAGAAGGIAGMKSPADLYVGLLESRTISDSLIARFKLKERYSTTMDVARAALAMNSQISTGRKDGMISITVSDKDPQVAADLANAYVEELAKLTQTMALTEASQRRLFFEKQLLEAKDQLANAEIALRKTQEKTGMIQPEGQVQALITNAAQLRGTIAAKEVQLNALRTFAAGQNPELLRAQEELRSLQAQLAKLEKDQPNKDGGFMVPTGKLPEVGVEYVRSMRNVKYYETIFELLAKQFELAKIDEAKNASSVQVLDKAIPAENKFKPKRALITLSGAFAGLVLGIALAFVRSAYNASRKNPQNSQRWQRLSMALKQR
jgi:tyrosine-protein kinase Etk/Wzc